MKTQQQIVEMLDEVDSFYELSVWLQAVRGRAQQLNEEYVRDEFPLTFVERAEKNIELAEQQLNLVAQALGEKV